jgi:DNA-binding MarR family transcriptional regulator
VTELAEEKAIALAAGMVKLLDALQVDRPSAWSKSFEGLSPLDLHVLAFVEAKPDVILKEIKDCLDVPNSTLTGIVDRLENKGLVERVISSRDRRSFGLKLTGAGRAIRAEQRHVRRKAADRMLEALDSDAEREAFVAMMVKISHRLQTGE